MGSQRYFGQFANPLLIGAQSHRRTQNLIHHLEDLLRILADGNTGGVLAWPAVPLRYLQF